MKMSKDEFVSKMRHDMYLKRLNKKNKERKARREEYEILTSGFYNQMRKI